MYSRSAGGLPARKRFMRSESCTLNCEVSYPKFTDTVLQQEEELQMKKIWSIVSAVVLLAVLATGCGGGSAGAASKNGSFELEGKTYTLPFALTDLRDNGWEPVRGVTWEELAEEDISENTLSWVDLTKDGKAKQLTVHIVSAPKEGQKITDCQVYSIRAEETSYDDQFPYSFSLKNGIKLRDTLDSVKELMGDPTYEDDSDNYISAEYIFDSENVNVIFCQDKKASYIYSIYVDVDNLNAIFK